MNVGFTIPVVKDTSVSFKLDRSLKARLVALAKSENRSLSNFIEKVLKEAGGNRNRTAEILQVSFKALLAKMKDYGLEGS